MDAVLLHQTDLPGTVPEYDEFLAEPCDFPWGTCNFAGKRNRLPERPHVLPKGRAEITVRNRRIGFVASPAVVALVGER